MIEGQVPHCGKVKLLGAEEEGTTLDMLVIWAEKQRGPRNNQPQQLHKSSKITQGAMLWNADCW